MQDQRHIHMLTCMVAIAIPVSLSFNIDTKNPSIYEGGQQAFFGYKVLQYKSEAKKGIIVTAPLLQNGSGGVCNETSQCISYPEITIKDETIPVKHLGLSMAANSGAQFTVCSPNVAHECYENSYLNSVCYRVTHTLSQVSVSRPSFQECRKKTVDLVFLFDGSASMAEAEFTQNKYFIKDIIDSLKNSSIKFAAIQFSTEYRKVFDFKEYQNGTALQKLHGEPHMQGITNTHKALQFVLQEILENPAAGASPYATKVLVLITDGDPSDIDRWNLINRYRQKNIIRFVIAVKGANLMKFEDIASQPTKKYAFHIENYDGLMGILENFQKQIFKMEGTKQSLAEDMTDEMSQSGFSAAVHNDTLILGSVGSNSWRGSVKVMTSDGEEITQIKDPDMKKDSYMGYSVSVGEVKNAALYFTGAPRFEHIGQVVLFKHANKIWTPVQWLNGDQIGSYFGAELCSVDIDSDGNTDFLLVGAPLFYHPQEKREGQLYVYALTDKVQLRHELNVTVSSMGRFGTTISSVQDLNGDGLRDVAVGAPLEDENSGAVYIYLGDRQRGIRSAFSQRITGREIKDGLRFFGQAIDGRMDMGEDELPDIVIGSKGTAVVLRSRPVFNVIPHLSFQPEEINTDEIDCLVRTNEILPMVNVTVCFEMLETTKSREGTKASGLNISYMLDVDPMRQTYRGFFSKTDKKVRNVASVYGLTDKETCFIYTIYMLKCVENTLSPVCIKLNFTQLDSGDANAVLNVDSRKQAVVEIPFEKRCRKNDQCIAELEVDLNFLTPTLLVAEERYFTVSVKLSNVGDDSYNTSLILQYPEGLSFSMMEAKEMTRPTVHTCYDQEGVLNTTVCGISLPVYRSKSSATFLTFFHIMTSKDGRELDWDDTISMTITGKSNNGNPWNLSSVTKSIPVQFDVKMAVTVSEDTVTYLNFTPEDSAPKRLEIVYNIANPGWKSFPVNVSLAFPTELDHDFEMKNYKVSFKKKETQCADVGSTPCLSEQRSRAISCDTFTLRGGATLEVTLSGDVQFKDLKERAANVAFLKRYTGDGAGVSFRSFIHVGYDETRYVLDPRQQQNDGLTRRRSRSACPGGDNGPTVKWTQLRVELIIPSDSRLIVLTGVALGLLLLFILTVVMFKMGCFKRRKLPDDEEEESCEFPLPPSSPAPDKQPGGGEADRPSEKNKLLDGGGSPTD